MYSHSGIMIQNYYRLRHSTASEDWLGDALVDSFTVKGSDGLEPDKLKYIWPGTIDQSVEEAIHGSLLDDPEKVKDKYGEIKKYRIAAFDARSKMNANGEIIDPLVVKPDPLLEAERPWVRDALHRVAEAAKGISGHYRFFCYTEAQASLGVSPEFDAPDRGPSWWASGTRATVCSSLICAAVHAVKNPIIRVEGPGFFTTPADLESSDTGAQVDFRTIDGLYFYTEEERRNAANWLYRYFYDLAYAKAGAIGTFFTDAPDDLANQVCNTLAFDWSGEDSSGNHAKDSDRWKNPGVGRAVSPDNIKNYWDIPSSKDDRIAHGLYGFSEKLIYREPYLEWRRISRWAKVDRDGELVGSVTYQSRPVAGAIVKAAGKDVVTGGNGRFLLKVPAGPYHVEAGKLIDGWFVEGAVDTTVNALARTEITIILQEPPEWFREITIRGTMNIKDEENWPDDDEYATRTFFQNGIQVGPFGTHAETSWTERMGGEIRVEVYLRLDWKINSSVDIWYDVKLFEGTSESTSDLDGERSGTVNVARDTTYDLRVFVKNDDEDDDDHVDLSLLISNSRRP
jgi:hypothetical protein